MVLGEILEKVEEKVKERKGREKFLPVPMPMEAATTGVRRVNARLLIFRNWKIRCG